MRTVLFTLAVFALVVETMQAQCMGIQHRLDSASAVEGDRSGASVAVSDSFAFLGAPLSDVAADNGGAVFVFRRVGDEWIEEGTLTASDPVVGAEFGRAIAVEGDRLLVGAPGADGGDTATGAAYLFTFDGSVWSEISKLVASDGDTDDEFGASVAVAFPFYAVGAPSASSNGAMYVQDGDDEWKLMASDGASGDRFGHAVDMDTTRVLVGAPLTDTETATDVGTAYSFVFDGAEWNQEFVFEETVTPPSRLGASLALGGTRALVAYSDFGSFGAGATMFHFDGSQWGDRERYRPHIRLEDVQDITAALKGDLMVLGSPLEGHFISRIGTMSLFRHIGGEWVPGPTLYSFDAERDDENGSALAIDGDAVLGGAPGGGYASWFRDGNPVNVYGDATPGSGGIEPVIMADGCAELGNLAFALAATDALGGALGSLMIGLEAASDDSDGWTRLVELDPFGLVIPVQFDGSGAGGGSLNMPFPLPLNPILHGIEAFFQFTVLDPGASDGIAATKGLRARLFFD